LDRRDKAKSIIFSSSSRKDFKGRVTDATNITDRSLNHWILKVCRMHKPSVFLHLRGLDQRLLNSSFPRNICRYPKILVPRGYSDPQNLEPDGHNDPLNLRTKRKLIKVKVLLKNWESIKIFKVIKKYDESLKISIPFFYLSFFANGQLHRWSHASSIKGWLNPLYKQKKFNESFISTKTTFRRLSNYTGFISMNFNFLLSFYFDSFKHISDVPVV